MRFLHKFKAVIRNAVTFAAVWLPIALAILTVQVLLRGSSLPPRFWIFYSLQQLRAGVLMGAAFSIAFAVIARRQTFASLSVARVALCGGLAGASFSLLWFLSNPGMMSAAGMIVTSAATIGIGAAVAGGFLVLARRAPAMSAGETALAELAAELSQKQIGTR